ncbi:MAG: MBL fold metallo-hydrolase [Pseudomonadales bacterium]|nr:MBL fold metallo-hydrolase [Pseudomonadales bacterium]NIX09696.1 MBL fold metallo-hydrolase [Pseudomonadales bacterium]
MGLGIRPFDKGLLDLGNGAYAWLQPDGSWGWSNAGLIVDGEASLLVDTLFDKHLTREMLSAMRDAAPQATRQFDTLVNTHSNGDHCNGNELVTGAEIVASRACAEELAAENPKMMQTMMERAPEMGEVGEFFVHCFGAFDFTDINHTLPTRTFEGELALKVGDKDVLLKQVGPAHTRGDVLAYVPAEKVIYTGDILFIEGHPILWVGPVGNWIDACDYMLDLDLENVVPGHGPVTDKRGVTAVRDYLIYIRDEARKRFDAGMPADEAALDISLADYDSWGDAERIVVNVAVLYKEFAADPNPGDIAELFALMAKVHKARRR